MNIQRTVLATHPLIRNTLLIVPLFLVIVVYFLREGITVDSLKFGQLQVEGLYLKLDKKLIAKVHYLHIPSSQKKLDSAQIETQLDRLKRVPGLFQYIALDDVVMGENHYRVVYRDNALYLRNDAYEVAGMLERRGDEVYGEIPYLYIKKYHIQLKGKFRYNYRDGNASMNGTYQYEDIAGNFSASQSNDLIRFVLNSSSFAHTSTLMKLPGVDDTMREWVDRRLAAKRYQIALLKGTLKHTKAGEYQLDPSSLNATFKLEKPVVRFHDKLQRFRAQSAQAIVENNVLYVKAVAPTYAGKDLNGTTFYLTNLLGSKPSKIHLEIKAKTGYDKVIAKLLKVYGVTLPLTQRSGSARNTVILDIMARSGDTVFKGKTRLSKSKIDLYGMPIAVSGGEVTYDAHRVTLHAVDADMGWLHALVSGTLKLDAKTASLSADVKRLLIGKSKSPLLLMKDKRKVPVAINWEKTPTIDLPLYKTKITLKSTKGYTLVCSDIRPSLRYLKGLSPFVKSGSVTVKTTDNKRYSFSGKVTWPSSYLYDKKGSITRFPFTGTSNGKTTSMKILGGRIAYNSSQNLIRLSHLYVDGKKVLDQNTKKSSKSTKIRVKGTQSLIRYEKYVLLTDRFDLKVNGKNTVFVATKDGDTVRTEINGNAIVVKAHRIKAPMLRALVHFGGLKGGYYSLDLHGNMKGTMRGVITIDGGTVSSFKTYNNLIALFNTVPALASLSDPGFSKNGFEVRKGRIEFRVVRDRIFFDMIYIDGKSAAISGKGTVSTRNGAINMDLAVRTARGIGKLIGSLPIVGYILMGKDKSITTGVKVSGTLENPKVTTNIVMETLLSPFKMFVRTLKSPAHIINQ